MPLVRARPIPRKRKPSDPRVKAVLRAFAIAKVHRKKHIYARVSKIYNDHMFGRIIGVIHKASEQNSWGFMQGCFYQAVEVYAVASLAYERYNAPIMSDALFDSLAAFLLKNFSSIPPRCVEEYGLRKDWFKAGTGAGIIKADTSALMHYNNRLQAHIEQEATSERKATLVRPRLLRKAVKRGSPKNTGKLRRPL